MCIKTKIFWFCCQVCMLTLVGCKVEINNNSNETVFAKEFKNNSLNSTFNFFIISDWGWDGSAQQMSVANQMSVAANNIYLKFIVSCGDNFQITGVLSAFDKHWNDNFEKVYKKPSLYVDWYPVFGNHDYNGNTQAELDFTKIDAKWKMKDYYYSFSKRINEAVSARFIFLDTPPLVDEYYNYLSSYPDIQETCIDDWFFN